MNNRLNKIILIILCQCFLSAPFAFASQTEKAYGENLITEGDISDLDGIALGLVASALSSCAGVAPDSNAIKVAGSNYLTARISNYKNLKELQKKVYKYEKNVYSVTDVNDVQKYSIIAEQYKDNLELIGVLEDSLLQQQAFKSSLSVARGIASTNIHQMKEHLTLCIVDVYYAAWHEIIATEPKN